MTLSAAGEGPELDTQDSTATVKASAADTGGYELFEIDAPRGPAVPPHADPWTKGFYVLTGRITVCLDGELHDLGPGSFVHIPAGTPNTFTVHTPHAKFLVLTPDDAMGRFFREIDATVPSGAPWPDAVPLLGAIAARHGVAFTEQAP
ncbi:MULTISPECIES: cupin domain-containing protein [unclassified Amycolatopsis]|uniref:cupin domain-containing protein n=1 Tax=unclassified Amycolatopsis TaxID=2618356 RepID=UPI00106E8CA6|nr:MULTISPECIES: cupin domain-containing protein [unclassified Amycolatopsis]